MWLEVVAWLCLAWYVFIVSVCSIGCIQLFRKYSSCPEKPVSSSLPEDEVPHVTIIRPCKGLEPYLYECLITSFQQDYPPTKLTHHFCVSSREDEAYPILQRMLENFPRHDARVLIEEDDPVLQDEACVLGPNPKIRNMSRAYREAKGDIVWILDCNIWVGRGACGRMVDKLCGFSRGQSSRPFKLVHHLPISVDIDTISAKEEQILRNEGARFDPVNKTKSTSVFPTGGLLDELFLASMHCKYYAAADQLAVVAAVVGKSAMFRRSHLNQLTLPSSPTPTISETPSSRACVGIDHFSHNICEDQLMGTLFFKKAIPSMPNAGKLGLVDGDMAIQPVAGMTVPAYFHRRVRWIRVRKFTVLLASFIEPGSESFLCSIYGAFAASTLPWFHDHLGIPQTWLGFLIAWLCSVSIWAAGDFAVYLLLHSGRTIEVQNHSLGSNSDIEDTTVPVFARPLKKLCRRPFQVWLLAWLVREGLAFPVWAWAFYGGVTVEWRDRKFWVGLDMQVHEIHTRSEKSGGLNGGAQVGANGHTKTKKTRKTQ